MHPISHWRTRLLIYALATVTFLVGAASAIAENPHSETLRVMSYNTWYVFAKGEEEEAGKQWVLSQKADVVALQELTNITDKKLQELATAWGHPHSALLKTEGFSVGLTSRWEITLVERGLDEMHHGFLHVMTNGIHYFVVHLSPFIWKVRQREAAIVMAKVSPLLEKEERVVVLGDFNAHSPDDRRWLEGDEELLESKRVSDSKHAHVENLRDGKIDFSVMQSFLEGGLADTATGHLPETPGHRLSLPTGIWGDKKTPPEKGQRIDFILSSPNLFRTVKNSRIVREGVVNKISDHYPVITDFGF